MTNKEYEGHNHTHDFCLTNVSAQNVVPSEPQPGCSRNLNAAYLLPLTFGDFSRNDNEKKNSTLLLTCISSFFLTVWMIGTAIAFHSCKCFK